VREALPRAKSADGVEIKVSRISCAKGNGQNRVTWPPSDPLVRPALTTESPQLLVQPFLRSLQLLP
jgi:hypothetical protein